jgi:hypothetical protein
MHLLVLFRRCGIAIALVGCLLAPDLVHAQATNLTLRVRPAEVQLEVGETTQLEAEVVDAQGQVVPDTSIIFFSRDRASVSVTRDGQATAHSPGQFTLMVLRPGDGARDRLVQPIPVTVPQPPIEEITFGDTPERLYAGTQQALNIKAVDASGTTRDDVIVDVQSSDPSVATVSTFGQITAHQEGDVTITAQAEGVQSENTIRVVSNPVTALELRGGESTARTGDVLLFEAVPLNANGEPVEDAPVDYTMNARPEDTRGPAATGQINEQGHFVAEEPGLYTIMATSGNHTARTQVRIEPRDMGAEIEVVGRGTVRDVHTSDLWVWEGVDGRDYAITGTWGGNGEAYFWDVTDPANIVPIDTVTVDARTVNDVKVSQDGRTCVISREGASDRKNGIVILDCTDPNNVEVITEYTEHLTGGVHNLFIYQGHVYALSNGRRYEIINIEDPANPQRVSTFELDTPGHSIHDVWVERGIAFSSNWDDGVVLTDVGNGMAGGSPSNPQMISSYAYPSGWNHAAFPYWDEETGKFYVIAGDEAFPNGLYVDDQPTIPAGWIHFIDFTDMQNPEEVARYQVPEAGTHNFWVDGDTLYVAYYNGGLRVVDISGRLMGNLYEQGREIAHFVPYDPQGRIANAPMTWGPQPHKGHIFISDWNSGLWALKLQQPEPEPEMTP